MENAQMQNGKFDPNDPTGSFQGMSPERMKKLLECDSKKVVIHNQNIPRLKVKNALKNLIVVILLVLAFLWAPACDAQVLQLPSAEVAAIAQLQDQCNAFTNAIPHNYKSVYKVGVLGNRGIETLYNEYNLTFADYLTHVVGKQFDPPIRFEIYPLLFGEQGILDKAVSSEYVDFTFMNPALYSCVESEVNANSLATFINRRVVNGKVFEMSQFGGVIFVNVNNTSVRSVKDIEGKRVATTSVTSLGSGQMQFRELQKVGLHHFQSLQQLIMMESQSRVVEAVILGEVDVGFVRTDQLERTIDPRTGLPLDLKEIRIVANQEGALLDTREPFPVALSTPLYPEWNFGALPHVSDQVNKAVQTALLDMKKHATLAKPLQECYTTNNCAEQNETCQIGCFLDLEASLQEYLSTDCLIQTHPTTALLAAEAMNNAKCAGWIPSKSYMTIRNMQEETGFIQTTLTHKEVRCTRTTEIVDAVVCPPNHFRRTREEVLTGCQMAGLDCYGFQCLCSPCVKAYDVDFFPADDKNSNTTNTTKITANTTTVGSGCAKFSMCGQVRQNQTLTFRLIDNLKRTKASFWAQLLTAESPQGEIYNMTPPNAEKKDKKNERKEKKNAEKKIDNMTTPNVGDSVIVSREFVFDGTGRKVGIVIVEVFVDDQQIPESPFRFHILPMDCPQPLEWTGTDCAAPIPEKLNLLPKSVKTFAYCLFALNGVVILLCGVWVICNRRTQQVATSQPSFLILVLLGCAISSSTIVAMAQQPTSSTPTDESGNLACMIYPWLYSIGFCITFGTLFAKIWRVYIIFKSSLEFRSVHVSVWESLSVIGLVLLVDVIILIVWTILDPLQWQRVVISEDKFGEPLESEGYCASEHWAAFAGAIAGLHLVLLLGGSWVCYASREVPTRFSEGKYVSIAMVSNLQIFVVGVPVLIVVGSEPATSFFVRTVVIWINDLAVVALIFGNLIRSVYSKNQTSNQDIIRTAVTQSRIANQSSNPPL